MNKETEELIDYIRWLANPERVQEGWLPEGEPKEFVVDAPEFHNILFLDLHILEVRYRPGLSAYQKTIIEEFARAFEKAAEKDRALYDVAWLVKDPYFLIAQKIASLL